jgi:phytoene/squalene synthetase
MEMDLHEKSYDEQKYGDYIYGSAEVVGLMCLKVFCDGDEQLYLKLKPAAQRLGAAFQKVNFLRDLKSDYKERGRVYFPSVDFDSFSKAVKDEIEADIDADFRAAYEGILQLPRGSRLGVYLAFIYYLKLFNKIRRCPAAKVASKRIRIPNNIKLFLLLKTYIRRGLNFI